MSAVVFLFRFQKPYRVAGLPFGIRSGTARVEVTGDEFIALRPRWVRTPLSNITSARVTGPYVAEGDRSCPPLAGRSRADLATNSDRGVCVQFARPVTGMDPWGQLRHPPVTVTVTTWRPWPSSSTARTRHPPVHVDTSHPTVDDLAAAVHDDLMALSAAELRRRAGQLGIAGASRRSKSELIELLDLRSEVAPGD
jgi:hypothetical protein